MQVLKKEETGEHPSSYFCKICSKRFISGRALGGHMRAHVPAASMAAEALTQTEFQKNKKPRASDDKSMEEKDEEEGLYGNGSNLMYAPRRNPKRSWRFADWEGSFLWGHGLDSNPIDYSLNSDLCGKEFSSWKGLFGHKNCHSENHQDSGDANLEVSHKHETKDEEEEEGNERDAEIEIDHPSWSSSRSDKWTEGKRFKRPRYAFQLNRYEQFGSATNNEEEYVAMCLVMLANGVNATQNPQFQVGTAEPESGDLKLPNNGSQLPKRIRKKPKYKKIGADTSLYDDDDEVKKARYKCTICNNVFHSHRALEGHRANHSKVTKDCFSQIDEENESLVEEITDEELKTGSDSQLPRNFHKPRPKKRTKDSCVKARDETRTIEPAALSSKKTLRVHECSICHRVFGSGQALGGHKRCHWGSAGASDTIITISSNKEMPMQQQMAARVELLGLKLPALVDDHCDAGNLNNLRGNAVGSHGGHSPHSCSLG